MTAVHWVDEPESNFVALLVVDEESGDTIEVQRAYEFDEQDRELGMDTYCLVRGGANYYGGLIAYELSDLSLSLSLTEGAAEVLELPESFEIPLDPASIALLRLRLPGLVG